MQAEQLLRAFVTYTKDYIFDDDSTRSDTSDVLEFHKRRRGLLNTLLIIIKDCNLHQVVKHIIEHPKISVEICKTPQECFICKETVSYARKLYLHGGATPSRVYEVRSDFILWLQCVYTYAHFGYYVIQKCQEQTRACDIDEYFVLNIIKLFNFCEKRLHELSGNINIKKSDDISVI